LAFIGFVLVLCGFFLGYFTGCFLAFYSFVLLHFLGLLLLYIGRFLPPLKTAKYLPELGRDGARGKRERKRKESKAGKGKAEDLGGCS
jgi:hypothetical protein